MKNVPLLNRKALANCGISANLVMCNELHFIDTDLFARRISDDSITGGSSTELFCFFPFGLPMPKPSNFCL